MANYYTDHPEIAFYLQHPLMRRIVERREKGFADKDLYPELPWSLGKQSTKERLTLPN